MRKLTHSALAAALALSLSAGAAFAATDSAGAAFEAQGILNFQPSFVATGYSLKIAGPGNFHREMLFTDEDPVGVSIKSLGQLVDGAYNYEITPIKGFSKRQGERMDGTEGAATVDVDSGTFTVTAGKVVFPDNKTPEPAYGVLVDLDEPSLAKDQVIADDLIVRSSLCVGIDCVNGESFGFDTIRLKENSLRIKFEDTSTDTFPSTDWQLTANDSASGGANKFSIEDITAASVPFTIEGSAPTNSLYVDDGGRLGIGTSTPVVKIHAVSGDTPGLRLEQNGSSGFTAQTWDLAGNEANFFIRDVTHGSRLPFRIQPGAPTSSIYIKSDGNVGFGTTSPAQKLELNNAGPVAFDLNNTAGTRWRVRSGTGNNLVFVAPDDATAAAEFTLDTSGNLTVAGNFFAQGGTQLNVPDYVFKSGYQLMTLDALQSFIDANGHLPNVRSEDEVAAAGKVNMTELQMKLLEKVEELTLYTLQQHDQIKALEARLERTESTKLD